jgi:uncharacterized RDD family membrane protein YckC
MIMNWFYANSGQQAGPVNDAELDRLVREGVIQPTTLVWREGMANWEPYAKVAPAPQAAPFTPTPAATFPTTAPPAGQVACRECGKFVPIEETMQINGVSICAACKPIYVQKMREGTVPFIASTPGSMRYGGFWIRVLAKFIDGIIVGIPVMTLYMIAVFGFGMGGAAMQPGQIPDVAMLMASLGLQLGLQVIGIILGAFYNVFFVVKYGATPGKMIVGLRIIMANGDRLGVGRAIGRYFAEMVSGMVCYIGYIIVAFDDQKRSLHDHMCSTRVVYK